MFKSSLLKPKASVQNFDYLTIMAFNFKAIKIPEAELFFPVNIEHVRKFIT